MRRPTGSPGSKAAEAGTTVTGLVRDYLTELVQGRAVESRFDRLQRLQSETLAAIHARGGGLHIADNHPFLPWREWDE